MKMKTILTFVSFILLLSTPVAVQASCAPATNFEIIQNNDTYNPPIIGPTNLQSSAVTSNSVVLNWNLNWNPYGDENVSVEAVWINGIVCVGNSYESVYGYWSTPGTNSMTFSNLRCGKTYRFKATGEYVGLGILKQSNILSVTTLACPPKPGKPHTPSSLLGSGYTPVLKK
jgi:hypothetical protein